MPDWNFGDGGMTACFFLDDELTRYIQIWPTTVLYFDLETGSEEVLWNFE